MCVELGVGCARAAERESRQGFEQVSVSHWVGTGGWAAHPAPDPRVCHFLALIRPAAGCPGPLGRPAAACGMSRLLGGTLERVCKAVLLLCLLHFLVAVILYFDVYAQHLAFFSRFSARGPARALHPAASSSANCSRPNATAPSSGLPEVPSVRPPGPTAPVLPPCPDLPPGLGEPVGSGLPLG